MTGTPHADRLRTVVERAERLLSALPESTTFRRPAPGKWSPREIIGHLIDSASNNHQRFVRAAWQDDLVFTGYDQERWVELQGYQETDWAELISLWSGFNRHIARVMSAVPTSVREREHRRHNLHEIAWQPVPADQPATLDYFMADYVGHLEHHLRQILGDGWETDGRELVAERPR